MGSYFRIIISLIKLWSSSVGVGLSHYWAPMGFCIPKNLIFVLSPQYYFNGKLGGNPGQKPRCGVWGVCGAIFIVNFEKRVGQKLRRIILLHFGLVAWRIHHFHDFRTSWTWPWLPKPIRFDFEDTIWFQIPRKSRNLFDGNKSWNTGHRKIEN